MDRSDFAYDLQWKIDRAKARLQFWYWNEVVLRVPNPLHALYTSIDREVIVVLYGFFVIVFPTLLSSNGFILPAVLTAIFGLSCARLLRAGRRKRRKEEMKDEVKDEVMDELMSEGWLKP